MDRKEADIMPILGNCYGEANAPLWWQRWRMFFMACAELFDYDEGHEWFVGHYLFNRAGH
jgi:cyclopropane-fatty-acyl-phospholipid synthase